MHAVSHSRCHLGGGEWKCNSIIAERQSVGKGEILMLPDGSKCGRISASNEIIIGGKDKKVVFIVDERYRSQFG